MCNLFLSNYNSIVKSWFCKCMLIFRRFFFSSFQSKYRPPALSRNQGEWRNHFKFSEVRDKQIETAKVLRKSQLFHIHGLSGSPLVFHYVYPSNSDFKRIFPDLTHVKTFFNNSSDKRLCIDIKSADQFFTSKFYKGRVKLIFFFLWEAIYHFDTAEFSS